MVVRIVLKLIEVQLTTVVSNSHMVLLVRQILFIATVASKCYKCTLNHV